MTDVLFTTEQLVGAILMAANQDDKSAADTLEKLNIIDARTANIQDTVNTTENRVRKIQGEKKPPLSLKQQKDCYEIWVARRSAPSVCAVAGSTRKVSYKDVYDKCTDEINARGVKSHTDFARGIKAYKKYLSRAKKH